MPKKRTGCNNRITFSCSDALRDKLMFLIGKEGTTISDFMETILTKPVEEYLNKSFKEEWDEKDNQ